MDTKICKKCLETKPLTDFSIAKGNASGRKNWCKDCYSIYHREWRSKDLEGRRAKARESSAAYAASEKGKYTILKKKASKYGLTPEQYTEVMSRNEGMCVICNERPAYHLDHCHTTNKVRGALCQQCNTGLGLFSDNVDILKSAISYLS